MDLHKFIEKYSRNASETTLDISSFDSPVGEVIALADEDHIYMVSFEDSKVMEKKLQALHKELLCSFEINDNNKLLKELNKEFQLYFDGRLKKFTVPIKTLGSDFQKEVWTKLQELPYGSTQTYGDLAKSMGRSGSHARAIGAACGANSHLVVVPCHRLVTSGSGDIGGFNSGIDRKAKLLQLEKKYSQ